jgi:hypothetical protein
MTERYKHLSKKAHLLLSIADVKPLPRFTKCWILAEKRSKDQHQNRLNIHIEGYFMEALRKAKRLLAQAPQTAFERDYRRSSTENAQTMHAFMSSSFYFYLECDPLFHYKVEFAFHNCPYEQQIRTLISKFQVDAEVTERIFKEGFTIYFKQVLAFQDSKFTYMLKAS